MQLHSHPFERKHQSNAGLTLGELVVSLALLGLLGSFVLTGLLQNQKIAAGNRSLMAAALILRQCTEYFQVCDSDDPMLAVTGGDFVSEGFDELFTTDHNPGEPGFQLPLLLDDADGESSQEATISRQVSVIAGDAASQSRLIGATFRVEYTNTRGTQQIREIVTNRAVP